MTTDAAPDAPPADEHDELGELGEPDAPPADQLGGPDDETGVEPPPDHELAVEYVPLHTLSRYHANPRRGDAGEIAASLRRNGQYRPLVVNRGSLTSRPAEILAGNHTADGAEIEGWERIAVVWVDVDDEGAARIVAADNRTADLGGYDDRLLLELLSGLPDLEGTGYDDDALAALEAAVAEEAARAGEARGGPGDGGDGGEPAGEPLDETARPSLYDRFLIPPFDVLDARSGWWRTRKRAWLSLGMRSEEGRGEYLTYHDAADPLLPKKGTGGLLIPSRSGSDPAFYAKKRAAEARLGRTLTTEEFEADHYEPPEDDGGLSSSGTSVFDPVLCELAYRWFSPPDGDVLDPFAGGSVRGLVAALLGRSYRGNDLSERQIAANQAQGDDFADRGLVARDRLSWTQGDSAAWVDTLEPESADLIFTCPPYLWLEQYDKGNDADISNMDADGFADVYGRIIAGAARALRPDRYAVVVTGNARDTKGRTHDLRAITVRAAEAAGLALHNTAVLVTPSGSLAVRAPRAFMASRALARAHQDVLVFVKGDRMKAADACGDVSTAIPDDIAAAFDGDPASGGAERPDSTPDLTPVEEHAGVLVKRDDSWSRGGASGAKSRTMFRLAVGTAGILTAGARRSPQIERAALVAKALDLPCRVHVPAGDDTDETRTCLAAGADVVRHKAGRLNVLRSRLRADSAERDDWFVAPFGMGLDEYADDVAAQVANLPDDLERLVVPCGSGMTLAGILRGLDARGPTGPRVLAVTLGHAPDEYLDRFAPDGWRDRVELVTSDVPFEDDAPTTRLGELELDPMYEAKCLPYLRAGDLLWCVGIRASAGRGQPSGSPGGDD